MKYAHPSIQVKYGKFGENAWFTREILIDSISEGKPNTGWHYILHWTFDDDWVINKPLPDSLFSIRFPAGIHVTDETKR